MKISTSFLALALFGLPAVGAQAQTSPSWASVRRISSTNGESNGRSIAVAADGSQYVSGVFDGTITLGSTTLRAGAGDGHIYLAKYDAAGTVLWATAVESSGSEFFGRVAIDAAGNAYLTGYFEQLLTAGTTSLTSIGNEAYVLKYNAQGVLQWAKQGGASGTYAQGIDVDASGNVTIAGDFSSSVSFGTTTPLTGGGVFLYRFSPTGTVLLAKQVSSSGFTNAAAVDGAGNTYITGGFDSGFTYGNTTLASAGGVDIFLVKVDAAGNVVWARRDGGVNEDNSQNIALDANGNPLLCGYYDGVSNTNGETSKIYVARYTKDGIQLWARQISSSVASFQTATAAAYDGRGGYYVTGSIQGTTTFGTTALSAVGENMFVARYDSPGNVLWAARVAGTNPVTDASIGFGIDTDASGNAYVTGAIVGNATFGTLNSSGAGINTFVAKLNAGGTVASTRPATAALKLSLYPNPAAGSTSLLLPAAGGRLVLSDVLGRTVREQQLPPVAGACPVSLDGLTPGLYQLRATLGNGQVGTAALTVR
ncbi:hypothetical protein LGH70_11070 [Hymenobacter sp. BT635]|uniref:T9SS type A sorting domain-containing protein n=1 Tax=Hymenobacter nitidus TaxID=2880929 RepID=A0ABS8ADV9_9BACT|nr:hypothetical protein [Hymenobacter nitidus]MCB2378127.1 hypothetical protein [Hymenobacter nitidus]